MTKNIKYWEKRAAQRFLKTESEILRNRQNIIKAYSRAQSVLERDFTKLFMNYYRANKFDRTALNSIAPQGDIKRLLDEFRRLGIANELPDNYLARATRLDVINSQIFLECKRLATQENNIVHNSLVRGFNDSYYHAGYDITQALNGQLIPFNSLDTRSINQALSSSWQGGNYSSRIWANTDTLAQNVQQILASGIATGASIDKMSRELRESFDVAKKYADRLIQTELNYIHGQAEIEAYKDIGVDYYKLIAVLDNRTSAICQYMDGKIFKTKEAKVGVNLNPFHPRCRTVSVPYLGQRNEPKERIARDPVTGENIYIKNMTYEEWRDTLKLKYANSNIDIDKILVKSWRMQYDEYRTAIGKEMIGYNHFVEMKLTGGNKALQTWWKDAKSYMRQYREGNLSDKWTFKQWRYNQGGPEDPRWRAVDFNPKLFYKNHYERHVINVINKPNESLGDISPEKYVDIAKKILNSKGNPNILKEIRGNGELMAYDMESGLYAVARQNGIIKTCYKPTGGANYWNKEVEKYVKKVL